MFTLLRRRHIFQETLSEYLDNRLTSKRRRQVELHLSTCRECQEELETLRFTVDLLHRVPLVSPRRSFTLSEAPAPSPQRTRIPTWAVGLATSAAMMGFLVLLSTDLSGGLASQGLVSQGAQSEAAPVSEALDAAPEAAVAAAPPPAEAPQSLEAAAIERAVDPDTEEIRGVPALVPQEVPAPAQVPEAQADTTQPGLPTSTQEATSIYWRIAEGALAALSLVLAGGLLWRWRRSSRSAAS